MRNANIVGAQIRRLRNQRGLSQNKLAIKLQLAGMERATRGKLSKIEARLVFVNDKEICFIAEALGVRIPDLFPDTVRNARRVYQEIKKLEKPPNDGEP